MSNILQNIQDEQIQKEDLSQLPKDQGQQHPMNIVWLDLEMTSLEHPQIIECGVIITDKDLRELERRRSSYSQTLFLQFHFQLFLSPSFNHFFNVGEYESESN